MYINVYILENSENVREKFSVFQRDVFRLPVLSKLETFLVCDQVNQISVWLFRIKYEFTTY